MYEAPSLEEWNEVRWNGILTTWGVFNENCCKTNEKWDSLRSYLRKKKGRVVFYIYSSENVLKI